MTLQAERNCGVIYLGASRFPYKKDLDKASFATAKQKVAEVLTPQYLVAETVESLDLFDQDLNQAQIVDQVYEFISGHPKMTDLIIYYCGHGGFLPGASFYLTLRSTKDGREATTGFSLKQFRLDLEDLLFTRRIYLLLDCCYAASAVDDWQSDGSVAQVIANDIEMAFPPSGTAMIAAASRKMPALAPDEMPTTLFSGHLVEAIRNGVKDRRHELTFADLADTISKRIRSEPPKRQVLPQLHVPRQQEGDVSRVPFIRNPGELPPAPASTDMGWSQFTPQSLKVTFEPGTYGIRPAAPPSVPKPPALLPPLLSPVMPPHVAKPPRGAGLIRRWRATTARLTAAGDAGTAAVQKAFAAVDPRKLFGAVTLPSFNRRHAIVGAAAAGVVIVLAAGYALYPALKRFNATNPVNSKLTSEETVVKSTARMMATSPTVAAAELASVRQPIVKAAPVKVSPVVTRPPMP